MVCASRSPHAPSTKYWQTLLVPCTWTMIMSDESIVLITYHKGDRTPPPPPDMYPPDTYLKDIYPQDTYPLDSYPLDTYP